jgi:pantetheine-phosphate adenylyltransferase
MSRNIAIFPGSFDPITRGHEDVVRRALPLFDEIIVAVGENSAKNYFFSLEKRLSFIKNTFKDVSKVKVETYNGLTIDYCKKMNASYILRGLRNPADFEFEKAIAQMNKAMAPQVDTVFIITAPELSAISSTIVRDILKHKGDASAFVPKGIDLK